MASHTVYWKTAAIEKLLRILQTSRYSGNNPEWIERKYLACLTESRRLLEKWTYKLRYRLEGLPCARLPLKTYPVIIYFSYSAGNTVSVFYVRHSSRKERAKPLG